MKQTQKWRVITVLAATIFVAPALSTGDTGPDEVIMDQLANLYSAVVFDHLTHQEIYDCGRCHHGQTEEDKQSCMTCHGGRPPEQESCIACHNPQYSPGQEQTNRYHIDTPGLIGAYHMLCRGCHLADGGPTDCQDCHSFTEKGSTFFNENR